MTDDPLAVTIDSLSPSVLPESGPVTITGTVTNVDDETWTGINLYPLISQSPPMTALDELNAAAAADPELPVGGRIVEVVEQVEALAPGQTAPYALRVSSGLLDEYQGVYQDQPGISWLGVHALGTSSDGIDTLNDGKARTFVPRLDTETNLLGGDLGRLDTALVLQLRRRVGHTVDGRVAEPEHWGAELAPTGRLRSIVDFGAAAGDRPVTWLVDPAVPDAVRRLMGGNPGRLPPAPDPDEEEPSDGPGQTPSEAPSQTPSQTPSESPGEDPGEDPGTPGTSAADGDPSSGDQPAPGGADDGSDQPVDPARLPADAEAWLTRLTQSLQGKQILALPYGDVDASAAASEGHGDLLRAAQQEGLNAIAGMGLQATPVVASPNGYLAPEAVGTVADGTTVLVSDRAVAETGMVAVGDTGRSLVVSSSTAVAGGPGPDDPEATVAMRQRLLSEAALRLLSGDERPLVAVLPKTWSPDDVTSFFSGLDQDWLNLTTLDGIDQTADATVALEQVDYPEQQRDIQLDEAVFDAADDLRSAGGLLQSVLPPELAVGAEITREAYADTAYGNRTRPNTVRAAATGSAAWVEQTLSRISLTTLRSVTLTGDTGKFPLTIHNGLDVPVTVAVSADPGGYLSVELPGPVTVNPGERFPLRPVAKTERIGAHNLALTLTNSEGEPIDEPIDLPVRSNQVSLIIWLVMIGGAVILFGVGGFRFLRRQRRKREAEWAE